MKILKISLLLFFTIISSIIAAQEALNIDSSLNNFNQKQINFAYGASYNIELDWAYSRLAKQGFNHDFKLGYYKLNKGKLFTIQATYMTGTLRTKGNDVNKLTNLVGDILLKYLIKIDRFSIDKLTVFGGMNAGFRSNIWFPKFSRLRYGWDIHSGIGISSSVVYNISSKLYFQYDMDLSLIGILWRPHNNGQQLVTEEVQLEKGTSASAFETPRFSHLFNTLYFDNSFKLIYKLKGRFDLYYNIVFSIKSIKEPLIKKGFKFNNLLGLQYNL